MECNNMYKTLRSFTHSKGKFSPASSSLILEAPIEIIINQDRHILIMITPQRVRELVFGFVFTEGLIDSVSEIEECDISVVGKDDGEQITEAKIKISPGRVYPRPIKGKRFSFSSCGICGKENYYELKNGVTRVKSRHRFSMEVLKGFNKGIQKFQPLYQKTGGAHAAILFDGDGNEVVHFEDVGRHNALDKVIGATLIQGISCDDKILVSSGRASLEMILKTARAGFPVFVAMSRPSSKAVEAAKFYNITLMDLAAGSNRVYTHARRIIGF
jgi:FdhD protein